MWTHRPAASQKNRVFILYFLGSRRREHSFLEPTTPWRILFVMSHKDFSGKIRGSRGRIEDDLSREKLLLRQKVTTLLRATTQECVARLHLFVMSAVVDARR